MFNLLLAKGTAKTYLFSALKWNVKASKLLHSFHVHILKELIGLHDRCACLRNTFNTKWHVYHWQECFGNTLVHVSVSKNAHVFFFQSQRTKMWGARKVPVSRRNLKGLLEIKGTKTKSRLLSTSFSQLWQFLRSRSFHVNAKPTIIIKLIVLLL